MLNILFIVCKIHITDEQQ